MFWKNRYVFYQWPHRKKVKQNLLKFCLKGKSKLEKKAFFLKALSFLYSDEEEECLEDNTFLQNEDDYYELNLQWINPCEFPQLMQLIETQ